MGISPTRFPGVPCRGHVSCLAFILRLPWQGRSLLNTNRPVDCDKNFALKKTTLLLYQSCFIFILFPRTLYSGAFWESVFQKSCLKIMVVLKMSGSLKITSKVLCRPITAGMFVHQLPGWGSVFHPSCLHPVVFGPVLCARLWTRYVR